MATTAEIGTLEELLESVRNASTKVANVPEAEIPTAGPDSSKPTGTIEGNMTEGARSRENEAEMKSQLGVTGAEGAPSPDANKKSPNEYTEATVATTGEDPKNESSDNSPVTEAEPGTSLPGMNIQDKVSAWKKASAEALAELYAANVANKTAKALENIIPASAKTAAEQLLKEAGYDAGSQPQETLPEDDSEGSEMSPEDAKLAQELDQVIQGQIAEAHIAGERLALKVAQHLETLADEGQKRAEVLDAHQRRTKTAMGGGGELPPDPAMMGDPAMAGDPAMVDPAMMDPAMGGGAGADPQMVAQALEELAAELGISVDELLMLLAEAEQAQGGEMDLGAPLPEEAGMYPGKTAAEKSSAIKQRIKKNAIAVLEEHVARGKR